MYLNRLPKHLLAEAIKISKELEHPFNYIMSKDAKLDELDIMTYDRTFEQQCIQTLLKKPITVNGIEFKPLKLIDWNVLWTIGSPIVDGNAEKIKLEDLDIFFWLTENDFDGDFSKIEEKSSFYCLKKYEVETIAKTLMKAMVSLVKIAFFPMTFYPTKVTVEGKKLAMFDADWLASVSSIVSQVADIKADDVLYMPLYSCFSYSLQHSKQNGTHCLERQPPEEVLKMKDERFCELLCDWFIKQELMKEEERETIMDLLQGKEVKKDGD